MDTKNTQTYLIKEKKKNFFKTKNVPYILILEIISYLCSTNDIIKNNNKIGMNLKTIYILMQCDFMFYNMFQFKITNYFNKYYRNNLDILNICRKGHIGFLKKIISNCLEVSNLIKDKYISNDVLSSVSIPSISNNRYGLNYPIILASQNRHLEIIKELYKFDNKCLFNKSPFGETSLIIASKKGYIEIVDFLIKLDCNYRDNIPTNEGLLRNKRDNENRLPLHWACINGYPQIAKLLCDNSNDLDKIDNFNKSPIIYAYQYGNYEVLRVLKEKFNSNQ
jgi:hypothetical protein